MPKSRALPVVTRRVKRRSRKGFTSPVGIFHCTGARTTDGGRLLEQAYLRGGHDRVRRGRVVSWPMRRTLKWGGIAACGAVVFLAGVLFGVVSHIGDPVVSVDIVNDALRPIATVTVSHEHGTVRAHEIAPGATRRVEFFAPGETSFRTTIEFMDGQRLEGKEQYAEAGYHITQAVTDRGIEDHVALF